MNNKFLFLTVFLSISFLSTIATAQPSTLFLKDKNYFSTIFKARDAEALTNAYATKEAGSKFALKSKKFKDKANNYNRMQKLPIAKSKIKKYNKKEQKYLKKAAKLKLKELDYGFAANQVIKDIYNGSLPLINKNKDKALFSILDKHQIAFLDTFVLIKSINTQNIIEKAKKWEEAYNYENKALLFMEYDFAVDINDIAIKNLLEAKYLPKKTVVQADSNKTQTSKNKIKTDTVPKPPKDNHTIVKKDTEQPYNIKTDNFVFTSEQTILDEQLPYTQAEEKRLIDYYSSAKNGFSLFQKAIEMDSMLSVLDKKIDEETDFVQKRALISQKREIIQQQAECRIEALKYYIQANKTYFSCRQNHFNDNRPADTNSTVNKKIKEYNLLSNSFLKDCDKHARIGDTIDFNKKYDEYKIANDQILTALKYQENGLLLQFDKQAIPVVVLHKLATPKKKQVTKAQNKKSKTQKNTKTPKKQTIAKAGLYSYSYANPTPQKVTSSKAISYKVQVGVSKYNLPINELKDYEPIYYEIIAGTETKRFMVGDFEDKTLATELLTKLKAKGYKDAYVVLYENGIRKGGSYNRSTTARPVNTAQTRVSQSTPTNAVNISTTKYLMYAIRIGTFASPKTYKELNNISNLYYKQLNDGRIQYFAGPYYSYSDATTNLPIIKQKGFADAFVTAYNNGQKISISSARKIEQAVKSSEVVTFSVQLGAFSNYLSNNVIRQKFGEVSKIYPISNHTHKGLIIYSAGKTSSFSEAKTMKSKIVSLGYQDCYIIAFKGSTQVPLQSVIH